MRSWFVGIAVLFVALGAGVSEDAGQSKHAPPKKLTVDLGGGVKLDLIEIAAGEFTMGDNESKPAHAVKITRPFYLGTYEVTQAQWEAVMGTAMPASCANSVAGDTYAVHCLTWNMRASEILTSTLRYQFSQKVVMKRWSASRTLSTCTGIFVNS